MSFTATVAGHPQIVKVASCKVVDRIGTGSYPLSVKTGMTWKEPPGSLAPGERLLFNSDGLTEARNANEREFGDSFVDAIAGWNNVTPAATLVETLGDRLRGREQSRAPTSQARVRRRGHDLQADNPSARGIPS